MSNIKNVLFELMEQDHEIAMRRKEMLAEEEEFVTVEEAKHQRSAESAGDEALDTLGR
jgi:hypothetical protein